MAGPRSLRPRLESAIQNQSRALVYFAAGKDEEENSSNKIFFFLFFFAVLLSFFSKPEANKTTVRIHVKDTKETYFISE